MFICSIKVTSIDGKKEYRHCGSLYTMINGLFSFSWISSFLLDSGDSIIFWASWVDVLLNCLKVHKGLRRIVTEVILLYGMYVECEMFCSWSKLRSFSCLNFLENNFYGQFFNLFWLQDLLVKKIDAIPDLFIQMLGTELGKCLLFALDIFSGGLG